MVSEDKIIHLMMFIIFKWLCHLWEAAYLNIKKIPKQTWMDVSVKSKFE